VVGETIDKALDAPNDDWQTLDDGRIMQTFELEHYGIKHSGKYISTFLWVIPAQCQY